MSRSLEIARTDEKALFAGDRVLDTLWTCPRSRSDRV